MSVPRVGAMTDGVRPELWDLDETFWLGTLTEGGIRYRRDAHNIVTELGGCGIIRSICSKNDFATVKQIGPEISDTSSLKTSVMSATMSRAIDLACTSIRGLYAN